MLHTPHVLDTCILGISTLVAAVTTVLVSEGAPAAQALELQLFLVPLIGALLASGGAIMLNPQPETRRIVIGRGIIALFIGTACPQFVALLHPALAAIMARPVVLFVLGGGSAVLAYVLSRPFFAHLYARADDAMAREVKRLEIRYSPEMENPVTPPKAPPAD